jgi:hypothetical protein
MKSIVSPAESTAPASSGSRTLCRRPRPRSRTTPLSRDSRTRGSTTPWPPSTAPITWSGISWGPAAGQQTRREPALTVPGLGNTSAFKNIPLSADGKRYVQLRVEAFNAFNHPQPSGYNLTSNVTNGSGQTGNSIFANFTGLTATDNLRPAGSTSVLGTYFGEPNAAQKNSPRAAGGEVLLLMRVGRCSSPVLAGHTGHSLLDLVLRRLVSSPPAPSFEEDLWLITMIRMQ